MKSAAGYFLALLRIFILTSIISKIKMGYKVGYLKTQKPRKRFVYVVFIGALQGTRTPDLLVRSQSLYPAELATHCFIQLYYYITSILTCQVFFQKK